MIQRYNGAEKDDEGAYVYYDDHLAAIARDREEREKDNMNCSEIPNSSLSDDLVRLAEDVGVPKKNQEWKWNRKFGLELWDAHYSGQPMAPRAAVDAALQEIDSQKTEER